MKFQDAVEKLNRGECIGIRCGCLVLKLSSMNTLMNDAGLTYPLPVDVIMDEWECVYAKIVTHSSVEFERVTDGYETPGFFVSDAIVEAVRKLRCLDRLKAISVIRTLTGRPLRDARDIWELVEALGDTK